MIAVSFGEDLDSTDLDLTLWWALVMATLEIWPDDDLWLLGDGAFDHLVVKPGMKERIYAERETNEKMRRVFEVMRQELPLEGVTDGWWFE